MRLEVKISEVEVVLKLCMNKTNIILGAGPAGIFCGHELKKLGESCLIIEKTDRVGGLAATLKLGDSSYEIGPHIFHTDDEYILDLVKDILGDDLVLTPWKVAQFLAGKLLVFPNQITDMYKELGASKLLRMMGSFLRYRLSSAQDFRSYIYKKVGKNLAEFNVINYTEKMWGIPIEKLDTEWIKPRMDRLSITKIIKDTISKQQRTFYYPRHGAGSLYESMAKELDLRLEDRPKSIHHEAGIIKLIQTNIENINIKNLYSSIPLQEFISLLTPPPPIEVAQAAKSLIHRSQIYVILSVAEPMTIDAQWIYFPEHNIPFCRVHSPDNFSPDMHKGSGSTLVFEYFCFDHDEIWTTDDESIILQTKQAFLNTKIVKGLKIVASKVLRKKNAYPLMSKDRSSKLSVINSYLSTFSNLYMIGRHGLHTYDNQHDAARTGIDAARSASE